MAGRPYHFVLGMMLGLAKSLSLLAGFFEDDVEAEEGGEELAFFGDGEAFYGGVLDALEGEGEGGGF